MYKKKIILAIVAIGLLIGGFFAYKVYSTFFTPNTSFNNEEAFLQIASDDSYENVKGQLADLLIDMDAFDIVAKQMKYDQNIKAGRYAIQKGANSVAIVKAIRSNNLPIKVAFNNQETLADLAGRIAEQLEADSVSLLNSFNDTNFLVKHGFTKETKLGMYIPNSYEFFWNTDAETFRSRMLKEYNRFWNDARLNKAKALNMTPSEVISLAAVVHKETAKVDERPRVAGVYLNRLKKNILLQADPTVIYAKKLHSGDFDQVIKRVLFKDLEIDSPYNTYKYAGVPPGPITMPDISAIDAVLNSEKHGYYYFVANVENFGYHKFAKTLSQHNRNKEQYIRWINKKKIVR